MLPFEAEKNRPAEAGLKQTSKEIEEETPARQVFEICRGTFFQCIRNLKALLNLQASWDPG